MKVRRLMQRRFGRVGTILILGAFLMLYWSISNEWHRLQQLESSLNGNITWQLNDCITEKLSVNRTPDQTHFPYNSSLILLSDFIMKANTEQFVTNQKQYGRLPSPSEPNLQSSPDAVFLIQVHNRLENLRLLIHSFSRVRGIEKSLLVFSADHISEESIALIQSISFARVVQIYFPHNTQVFPDLFPGRDPHDCGINMTVQEAKRDGCVNAEWFDRFKHYRNSRFTQVKHHWLWKLMFVFERLHAVKFFTGYVILLEEDHFVVEDIIHVQNLTERIWKPEDAKGLIAFGSYLSKQDYKDPSVQFAPWVSSRDNLGMGISRAMWKRLKRCLDLFCTYDDYNWDWSLQHIGSTCLSPNLQALQFTKQTRVYHLGQCGGLHFTKSNCSVHLLAQKLTQSLQGPVAAYLFPTELRVSTLRKSGLRARANGGWSDLRDRALCKSIANAAWQPEIEKYAQHLTRLSPL